MQPLGLLTRLTSSALNTMPGGLASLQAAGLTTTEPYKTLVPCAQA